MEKAKRIGDAVSVVGICLNFLLAAAKIIFGALFGYISIVADGVNNLSDMGSGVVSIVSFRIAAKPADKEHPYGHQRAEYIASMLIGFFVLLIAFELVRESIEKIIAWEIGDVSLWAFVLLASSVAVKAGMFVLYRVAANKINSDVLSASAIDSLSDCIATTAVISGMLISRYAGVPFDGIAGLIVVAFVLFEGIGIVKKASSRLLGQAPDPELVEKVKEILLAGEGVLGVHDLKLFGYGAQKFFATAHIEMDANLPSETTHARIDFLERKVLSETQVELTVHFDPVDPSDEEAKEIEARIRAALEGVYEGINLHDFRLVRGEKNKIIFEAGVPFALKASDREVKSTILSSVKILTDAEAVVTVERE
ncbi:MAG: cation diffusion facilitator family transporter [Clostridia bacterium]|nr:cation diffusion facilitator family transporter [Clostridia bacterium]